MLINIINPHHHYSLGEHTVSDERGNYLISMGIAEEVGTYSEKEIKDIEKEKIEFDHKKEKVETKGPGKRKKTKK